MSALDVLIADLKAAKTSGATQVVFVPIDDFVAAIVAIQGGQFSSPGGNAGGDLAGTYPNPQVAKLQGTAISANAPNNGQKLTIVGGVWTPQ